MRTPFLLVSLLVACGSGSAQAPRAPSTSRGEMPAAPSPAIGWRSGTKFPSARDHHATFIAETHAGAYLYVVGGATMKDYFDDGWRARIADDGGIGAWEPVARLPTGRAGSGLAVDGRNVVLVAGKAGKTMLADVVLGSVADDGALAWRAGPPLPAGRFHLTCSLARGVVFAIGGLGSDFKATSSVFSAKLRPDGSLDPWAVARDLPAARSHHAAVVHGDTLYLVGGLRGDPRDDEHVETLADVIAAKVAPDGTLGEWRAMPSLDAPLATHSAVVEGGQLFVLGGIGKAVSDRVLRAPILPDGALGAWVPVADPLPRKRAHVHQTPAYRHFLYSVGGNGGEHVPIDEVSIGALGAHR